MGLCAPKAVSSVFATSALLPALALLVFWQAHRCSAGFATLNLLPHEKLHKGRGIAEEHAHISRKPARLTEDYDPLRERLARPTEDQERQRKALRTENYTASSGRSSKLRPSESKLEADEELRISKIAGAGPRRKGQEPGENELLKTALKGEELGTGRQQKATAAPEPARNETEQMQPDLKVPEPEEDPIEKERRALEQERKAIAEERRAIEQERRAIEQEKIAKVLAAAPKTPPRSKRLDIVLSHFHPQRVQPALDFWLDFLESPKVQQWQPYVWLYCQNENVTAESVAEILPLLQYGGELVNLENVGRESHSFLQHITGHYNDLADYTMFSQDIPEAMLVDRFEKMFDTSTGFLPLSLVAHVPCKDEWLPAGTIEQMYALLTRNLCPPEGYTGAYQGQFLVSRKRIRDQNWWVYKTLLDMLAAPLDHWVHNLHDNDYFKDRSNPFFGHVLERTWSLAFNCYESWRHGNCWWCDNDMHMEGCGTDACQCLDKV